MIDLLALFQPLQLPEGLVRRQLLPDGLHNLLVGLGNVIPIKHSAKGHVHQQFVDLDQLDQGVVLDELALFVFLEDLAFASPDL